LLIFEELDEFTVTIVPKTKGRKTREEGEIWWNVSLKNVCFRLLYLDQNPTLVYKQYQQVENDFVSGAIQPNELKNSIYQCLGK
jgi:hypothetical protein